MTPDTLLYLVADEGFTRDGLESLLREDGFFILSRPPAEFELDIDEARWQRRVILIVGECAAAIKMGIEMRGRWPSMRVAILADQAEPDGIGLALKAGVDGLFHRGVSRSALVKLVQLVAEGEVVLSTAFIRVVAEQLGEPVAKAQIDVALSSRDMEVLRGLTEGLSNKFIARRMGITEAAVKVCVTSVLRKLKLSNRTQAGIWASGALGRLPPQEPDARARTEQAASPHPGQDLLAFIRRDPSDGQR